MIIMKFGGTSVEDAPSVQRVAEIIRARLELKPVVVVSAMGKTTRKLLDAAKNAADGESNNCAGIIAELKAAHTVRARALFKPEGAAFALIEKYFDELSKLLEGLAILGEVPPRGLDKILSYGELLSSAIVGSALNELGIPARLVDSREFIRTDERYGSASPIFDLTDGATREAIGPLVAQGYVPVVQGFIGSTRQGATTTLGFEGSDYTASIIGAALGADDIQIWKNVPGLMTADPEVYSEARTVKLCSFAEAAELTFLGAKVLHPKAIHPAARANIPVHIYDSREPSARGTEIRAMTPRCLNAIKSIAYKRPVTIVNISPDSSRDRSPDPSSTEFLRSLLLALNKKGISPLLLAASGSNLTVAIDPGQVGYGDEHDLIEDLSSFGRASAVPGNGIVSIVGEELRTDYNVTSRLFESLAATDLPLFLRGCSPIAASLVIREELVEQVIARIHAAFFKELDNSIFE
jgi:aspartate kinase